MKHKILDSNQVVDERYLRNLLYEYELDDLEQNSEEYMNKELDIKAQMKCVELAVNGTIEDVLYTLETSWGVSVTRIESEEE